MRAAADHGIRSPLIELNLSKADVRNLARDWDLSVSEKPAAPCLASRIAYGVEVNEERVARIEQAEAFLRELTGISEFRVRLEANELARIEVPVDDIARICVAETRQALVERLRSLGFRSVTIDLEGFRSGNLNAALSLVQLGAK
jgi:uncharacterized protein